MFPMGRKADTLRLSCKKGRNRLSLAVGSLILLALFVSLVKSNIKIHDQLDFSLLFSKDRFIRMRRYINLNQDTESQASCEPLNKIAFAKTHKTGSSTLQNIFFRYGSANNLTFMLPEKSWMFSFKESFNVSMVENLPWAKLGYDIFTFHSIWNYSEVKKMLPTALYITLLRDPVDCYESNYVYMGLQKSYRMDINEFAKTKGIRNVPRMASEKIGKNQQLWDLGLGWREMENISLVQQKIEELDKEFHFVLLLEHFDEGLVILAKLLCWNLEDMRYLRQNVRKQDNISKIEEESRIILRQWLQGDQMLYDHFKKKFEEAADRYGRDELQADVERLRQLNEQLTKDCVIEVADNTKLKGDFRTALSIVEGYVIDPSKPWCSPYALSEPNFSVQVRKQQQLRATSAAALPVVEITEVETF